MTSIPDLGNTTIIESSAVKPGEVIIMPSNHLIRETIFAHGLTLVWLRLAGEPNDVIHRASMVWIERHIDMMARIAEDRIMNMHRHRDDFELAHG